MGKRPTLPGVGRVAERDDIAPEGEIVTVQHVRDYRASVEQAFGTAGLPAPQWGDDES